MKDIASSNNLPKCYTCKNFCIQDTGYSDYTVTGSIVECLLQKFEERRREYGKDREEIIYLWDIAQACEDYREGAPLELNVECNKEAAVANHYFPGVRDVSDYEF